ncbi:L-selectin-like [Lutzomyia longipalpis]|uniref:Putative c-type lectin n=1 Tax=Lutzomyia longipalpis TaxID=7200 RepID=A0A7G3AF25_LUTLO|nr:L-selectin-like [Lutzomyia longipalpis]
MALKFLPVLLLSCFAMSTALQVTEKELSDGKKIFISKVELNWFEALDFCIHRDLTLLSIKSAKENEDVTKAIRAELNFDSKKLAHVWTGGIRHSQDKYFRWINDGTKVVKRVYTNWFTGEPNNGYWKDEFCLEIYYKTKEGKWNDDKCHVKHHFVCQEKK